jgi:PKD repeat protein
VTDDRGATATASRTVMVQSAPTASFTATPASVAPGGSVSFNASASADAEGPIAKYEWDLDGNGSYETDTGATATTSRTYTTSGTVTVGLRVTDGSGSTAATTRTVTVTNTPPTASFTVSPSPAATRQVVTFNASGSTDNGGSIARYEWDLDGNGSYEVNGGTSATTTKTFTTVGPVTIGLRVTDNGNATATTTRALTVNSAYAQSVLGTTGVRGYWRLGETTGTTAADASTSNNPGTISNGPLSVAGLLTGEANNARDFDGVNDFLNLSPTPFGTPTTFSAEAWVRTGSTKSSGNYHYLISNSSSDFNNGFTLAIDSSNRATFVVARNVLFTLRGQATSSVTLPPNTTHHVVGTYDGSRVRVYVDGVERGNASFSSGITYASGRDINIGRKVSTTGQAANHLDGILDEPALYTSALSAATVTAHYNAGKP